MQSGRAALAAEVTATWGGLYLHADAPLDLSPYTELRFFARATAPGQQYWIYLVGTDNRRVGNAIPLAALGGLPLPGVWTEYRIPLDAAGFNAPGPINGIILQDLSGSPHPPLFLDELAFRDGPPPAPGSLTLALTVVNDHGGTATAADLVLRLDGAAVPAGLPQSLPPGPYRVTADPLPGYAITIAGACDPDGAITLPAGVARVCTVVADDLDPAIPGRLYLYDIAFRSGRSG